MELISHEEKYNGHTVRIECDPDLRTPSGRVKAKIIYNGVEMGFTEMEYRNADDVIGTIMSVARFQIDKFYEFDLKYANAYKQFVEACGAETKERHNGYDISGETDWVGQAHAMVCLESEPAAAKVLLALAHYSAFTILYPRQKQYSVSG